MQIPKVIHAYLQLVRVPNVFSAISNVLMGYLFVAGEFSDIRRVVSMVCASSLIYFGGMILNDVFDFEVDSRERPSRPLPSGRISKTFAGQLGMLSLLVGCVLAVSIGWGVSSIAVALAAAVLIYDGWAKKNFLGPLVMGSCRFLNILLGMSVGIASIDGGSIEHLFSIDKMLIAGGVGVYVVGITIFAKNEAEDEIANNTLWAGLIVMAVGIGLLAAFPWWTEKALYLRDRIFWPTLLVLLLVSVVRRCVVAISNPSPQRVQEAVKNALFTLIVLDAAVTLVAAGPLMAILVIALLVPTFYLGKIVYAT